MEKLIKLLNEYEEDKIKGTKWLSVMYVWKYEWTLHYYNNYKDENIFDNVRFLIISKEYWFIQWLVENNKIEFREDFYLEDQHWWWFGEDEDIIMILSIQDNPIEFLVSILK